MVISRAVLVKNKLNEEVYYDYGAIIVPYGLINVQQINFFNHENIEEILHYGYVNEEEEKFQSEYEKIISNQEIKKGKV